MDPAWFVSDIHVRYGDPAYRDRFIAFLAHAAQRTRRLFVVGDLFEFWIGDQQGTLAFYDPVFSAFADLVRAGVQVGIIQGNRDFMVGERFERLGATLLLDEVWLTIGRVGVRVSHGDELCVHDHSYQAARVVMRSSPFRAILRATPVFFGLLAADRYRGISKKKHEKWYATAEGNRFQTVRDGVERAAAAEDPDVFIFGHIHHRARQTLYCAGRDRTVITTGAWEEAPNYVRLDDSGFTNVLF